MPRATSPSGILPLEVWSLDHWPHLGARWQCRTPGPFPDLPSQKLPFHKVVAICVYIKTKQYGSRQTTDRLSTAHCQHTSPALTASPT